jgi:hypothetical protein
MLIFEDGGVVEVVGSPQKQAYALVFEGGGGRDGRGGGVGKGQPSLKTSMSACFRRWRWCRPRAGGGGGGGGGDKEQLSSKMSRVCLFSRVEVVMVLARSNHP